MIANGEAHLISLGLTVPTVAIGIHLLIKWRKEALKALWEPFKTPTQWLILGVAIGFAGNVLDNLYWAVPWTLDFLNCERYNPFFKFGVYANIPFRQTAGIMAGYCHLRSFAEFDTTSRAREMSHLSRTWILALFGGILYAWFLWSMK